VRGLRLLYLALGAATAFLNPFIPVILQARGLDPAEIGLVTALAAVALIVAIAAWGHIGDAILGRRRTLQVCAVLAIGVAFGIGLPVPGLVLAGLVVAFTCTQGSFLALADSVSVNVLTDPRRHYGRIRMLASLSFAVAAILVGILYDRTGYGMATPLYAAAALAMIVAVIWTPDRPPVAWASSSPAGAGDAPDSRPKVRQSVPSPTLDPAWAPELIRSRSRFGSTGVAFSTQPRLLGVLTTVALVWFSVMVSFTFLSLRIVDLGGRASDVALASGISAFAEIPGMLLAARFAGRIGLRGLFSLSTVGFAACFVAWAFLNSPDQIVVTRLLTGFCYGGMTVSMVLTMGELLPTHLQVTGQTLYQGTATGVAAVAGNSIGGLLYGFAGAPVLFVVCAVVAVAGAMLGLFTLPAHARAVTTPPDIEEVVLPNAPLV
jgi:MFS transporter, PPP family, 3-phenylpropionic acid transporter